MRATAALAAAALVGWIGGCGEPRETFQGHRLLAMGTWVDVAWEGPATVNGQRPEILLEALLRDYEREFYPWADGELAALNTAIANRQPFALSTQLERLLASGVQFHRLSNGSFDPGVGRLVDAWGFGSDTSAAWIPDGMSPSPSIASLNIADGYASSADANLVLDLGGYAKGDAVDLCLAALNDLGLGNAIVNAGGDLRVSGERQGRRWQVGIVDPNNPKAIIGSIWLEPGEAAFTSGDYVRSQIRGGQLIHHLIDPSNGTPALHTRAVTVIADNGMLADAGATAIFVAGPDDWAQVAQSMGIDKVLRIARHGDVELTAAMERRFTQTAKPNAPGILIPGTED